MKKVLFIVASLVALIVSVAIIYKWKYSDKNLSNEEIRIKFECERVTADYRKTDIYCQDPDLYRQHLKDKNVVEP